MAYRFRYLPFVLFIASGAFALVYEVTWSRYLGLFIGNTNLANMCVLASFMGGLALGSVLIGARTVRFARPLAVYGWLEVVIGLYAVLFPLFIQPVQSATLAGLSASPPGTSVWVMAKLAVSVLVLLLPTVLMGGTFPVLMKHFQPEPGEEDKAEWLYLANCVGAVGGALAAGFMLIPEYGLWGTLIGIGGANLALGLIAVVIAFIEPAAVTYPAEAAPSLGQPQKMRSLKKLVYIAIAASGITAMVYELSWFRLFALTLGSSTYSFTLMVSAFITGIALGSMIVGFSPGMRARPLLSFAIAEIGIALIAVLSIPVYVTLPYLFWKWSALLTPSLDSLWLYNLGKYGLCFLVMVVPTVFFGMTLPLAIKAVARRDEQIGRDSGYVYGANTAGNIAGALLAGFILIPLVGLRHSLEIALAANVLIGAALLWGTPLRLKRPAGGFICAVVFVLIFAMPRWHPAAFTSGIFRLRGDAPENWKQYRQRLDDRKVLYYKEDGNGITAVLDIDDGSPQLERTLLVNGKADASAPGDMPTQALSAHIPMFLMPKARDALVIGLGSGVTAGCVLTHPGTRVDCVEISPAVGEAARHFSHVNENVLDSKKFNLILEDARTYVGVTRKKYDLVISEPSNPWIAGIGNLYSEEFFRSVDKVLKPHGALVQWIHTYEMSDDLVKMVIRTVTTVFPYAYVFEGAMNDYIILAVREPLSPDLATIGRKMKIAAIRESLDSVSVDSVAALLGRQALSPPTAVQVGGQGPVNRDDFPLLEFKAPVALYVGQTASILARADERLRGGQSLFAIRYLKNHPLDQSTCRSLIRAYSDRRMHNPPLQVALLDYYVSHWPEDAGAVNDYVTLAARNDISKAVALLQATGKADADWESLLLRADTLFGKLMQAQSAYTPQDFAPVLALLDQAAKQAPDSTEIAELKRQVGSMYY